MYTSAALLFSADRQPAKGVKSLQKIVLMAFCSTTNNYARFSQQRSLMMMWADLVFCLGEKTQGLILPQNVKFSPHYCFILGISFVPLFFFKHLPFSLILLQMKDNAIIKVTPKLVGKNKFFDHFWSILTEKNP